MAHASEERPTKAPTAPVDPVVEAYKQGIDRTLLRENLKLSHEERIRKLSDFLRFLEGLRGAARRRP